MFRKAITFDDYNGVSRTMNFLFNISEAELMEMQLTTPGGFKEHLERITAEKDQVKIMNRFKEIILMAYGELDDDGIHFKKSKELSEKFASTPAYAQLYIELMTNEQAAADFVNGILPKQRQAIPAPPVK